MKSLRKCCQLLDTRGKRLSRHYIARANRRCLFCVGDRTDFRKYGDEFQCLFQYDAVTFFVCPVCGNIIHSMGEAVIQCHGVQLQPEEAEPTEEEHKIFVERVEDEYYVRIEYEMSKSHYISFIAAVSKDGMQMVKLYPEGNAEARFKINGVEKIYFYCNRSGLFFCFVYIEAKWKMGN